MTTIDIEFPASLTIENVVTFVAMLRDASLSVEHTLSCDASNVELMTTPAVQALVASHKQVPLTFINPSPAFTATLAAFGMTNAFA